jgi:hypothetical protein
MLKGKLSYQKAPLSQAFQSSRSIIISRPGRGFVRAGTLAVERQNMICTNRRIDGQRPAYRSQTADRMTCSSKWLLTWIDQGLVCSKILF